MESDAGPRNQDERERRTIERKRLESVRLSRHSPKQWPLTSAHDGRQGDGVAVGGQLGRRAGDEVRLGLGLGWRSGRKEKGSEGGIGLAGCCISQEVLSAWRRKMSGV